MKTVIKTIFSLLLLFGAVASAQAQAPTLSLKNITGSNATDWKYGTVTCTSPRAITSITLSMINNTIVSNSSGITPSGVFNSLGVNPRTVTYVFTGISSADVKTFIEGITFRKTTEVAGANNHVRISVDANPTSLPAGATITAWENHPDGTPHYYVWVASSSIHWDAAYNAAKSYYFQGMRGYLATVTSSEENTLLINISTEEGWSGGVRTANISDGLAFGGPPQLNADNYRWACGPEFSFVYYNGTTVSADNAGPANNAFNNWRAIEPNNSSGENCMQINFTAELVWNDYASSNTAIRGYFIEFGGSGEAYSVNGANYPANPAYKKPDISTTNAQWQGFSPGNTSSAATTIKSAPLHPRVMVFE